MLRQYGNDIGSLACMYSHAAIVAWLPSAPHDPDSELSEISCDDEEEDEDEDEGESYYEGEDEKDDEKAVSKDDNDKLGTDEREAGSAGGEVGADGPDEMNHGETGLGQHSERGRVVVETVSGEEKSGRVKD
jgi:hypothetical protein